MELREWLFRKRMTVTELAKELGVSRPYLNSIVLGVKRPGPQLAKKIEEATNGSVKVLELLFPETKKEK